MESDLDRSGAVRESLFRDLFEQAGNPLLVLDAADRIHEINDDCEAFFGVPRTELVGRPFAELHEEEWLIPATEAWSAARRTGTASYDCKLESGDRERFLVDVTVTRFRHEGETMLLLRLREPTEVASLRRRLRQAHRMEAVGRLAGGVAHDFNNLLTGIIGYADMLAGDFDLPPEAAGYVEEIRKAGFRASSVTRQLLAFSRRQILRPAVIDVNRVVEELHGLVRQLLSEEIELELDLSPGLWRVVADRGQVERVILDLVTNARDAMPHGGRLRIATENVEVDEEEAARDEGFRAGSYVMMRVQDDGVGMDEVTVSRAFEPFFTTKRRGSGSGLGLATVYGFVKQSGGWVYVDSAPHQGTVFRLYLPRVSDEEEAPTEATEGMREEAPAGGETVLVVEDEEALRGLVAMVLRSRGFEVLEAGEASAAEKIVDRRGGEIDLLLSDVVLPGLSGPELARKVARRRPEIKVLFMTGYSDETVTGRGLDDSAPLLQKPFTARSLVRAIRGVLDE